MVSFYFFILIPLITATRRFDGPSYRSNSLVAASQQQPYYSESKNHCDLDSDAKSEKNDNEQTVPDTPLSHDVTLCLLTIYFAILDIMEGDKPILRMSPNADYAETNSDEGRQKIPPPKTKDPALVRDMGLLVKWLMENFSYDVAPLEIRRNNNVVNKGGKPILRMPPSDTSDSDSDEDKDSDKPVRKIEITESQPLTENPVTPPGELSEEPPLRPPVDTPEEPPVAPAEEHSVESENSDGALRTKHKTEKHKEDEANPEWVKDLKEYIKDLTTRYGQQEVLEHAKPVIASLEKKHNMKIKDIDVDEYGEILITFIEKGKGKKTARKRKKSDDT